MDIGHIDVGASSFPRETEKAPPLIQMPQLLRMLRQNAWLLVLCSLLAALAAYAFSHAQPQYYTASGTLALEGKSFALPELQGAVRADASPDPMPWVRTEEQALTTREIVQPVIAKLGLEKRPEFNPALRPKTISDEIKSAVQDAMRALLPAAPQVKGEADGPDQATLNNVMKALVITQDNRSLVIGVAFTSQDPVIAAKFVNTLVADYLTAREQRSLSANQGANAAIVQQIDQVRGELNSLEEKMRALRSKGDLVTLRAGSVGQQQLEDLATAASKASLERAELEAQWHRANALAQSGSSEELANVLSSPTIGTLRQQESQSAQRVADLSAHYGPNHPGLRSAEADLETTREQLRQETQRIVSSLNTQLNVARAHEADTKKQLEVARRAGVLGQNAQAQVEELQQEIAARRTLYQTLLQGAQQTVSHPSTATVDVRVLSSAVPPSAPSGPNSKMAAGMGGMGGLLLGGILAFTRAHRADMFAGADEAARMLGVPVLASFSRRRRRALLARARANKKGPEAEALRLLRSRLRAESRVGGIRKVLFSAFNDAGTPTEIASAFAYVAAADGERVLLIEGNLHRPMLAAQLGVREANFLPVLEGKVAWRDLLLSDRTVGLDMLLTVTESANAHALLAGAHFENLLSDVRDRYDLIVISGAAAESSDALVLTSRAEATVLVIDEGKDKRTVVRKAFARFAASSSRHLAAVMLTAS